LAGKIFNRLSVKVFLISFIVQVLSGVLICFVLYSQTPEMLYSPFDELDDLIEILADTPRDEGEVLIDDFIRRNDVDIVIYDDY
jgi:two-component system sensor histidine kinase VanS